MLKKIQSVLSNRIGNIEQNYINFLLNRRKKISHNGVEMIFSSANSLSKYRANSFATKEPDTLAWIDSFKPQQVMWDIGANVGIYSIYAAKSKGIKVYAFEPSVFNLETLARNINANNLQDKIVILPIPLSNQIGVNTFRMHNPKWGSALSVFGENYDYRGNQFNTSFSYATYGISADNAIKLLALESPAHLKIDVDGIEHIILAGAENVLRSVKSVMIEINDDFIEQSNQSSKYLNNAGLTLTEKFNDGANIFNQLWVRK